MYDLKKAYGKNFFARRKSLDWRAPIIVNAIMMVLEPRSLIDFGCARGEYVQGFINCGVWAYGLEGSPECLESLVIDRERILIHDLRKPIPFPLNKFNLCLCLEVVEHIEEKFVPILLDNFRNASDRVLISAAPPGQGGLYHVNCKPKDYWVDKFNLWGYTRDTSIEDKIKSYFIHYLHRKEIKSYYSNLLFFSRG